MTISSENRVSGPYPCNGSQTAFAFNFKVFKKADVRVVHAIDGVETDLVLDTDFTVTLNADQDVSRGGSITTLTAYATGVTVTITSQVAYTQPTDMKLAGGYYLSAINDALDRLLMQVLQLKSAMDRAVTLPVSGLGGLDPTSLVFGVDGSGEPILRLVSDINLDTLTLTPFAATLLDDVNAATARSTLGLGTAATLNVGTAANRIVQLDGSAKIPAVDGSQLTNLSVAQLVDLVLSNGAPNVRQTVYSGPVDADGLPAFGGTTGSTSVSAAGDFTITAAGGGLSDRTESVSNPSWTGLSVDGVHYLYADIDVNGNVTYGHTTQSPVYQPGGTYSTVSGAHTFNIQEMIMKVGNGAAASQVFRVFFGEATVTAGVVSAIVWYAIQGRYFAPWTSTLPGASTAISRNHNLGCVPLHAHLEIECLTADANYAVGDKIVPSTASGGLTPPLQCALTRRVVSSVTGNTAAFYAFNKTTGVLATLTAANWKYRFFVDRGW